MSNREGTRSFYQTFSSDSKALDCNRTTPKSYYITAEPYKPYYIIIKSYYIITKSYYIITKSYYIITKSYYIITKSYYIITKLPSQIKQLDVASLTLRRSRFNSYL